MEGQLRRRGLVAGVLAVLAANAAWSQGAKPPGATPPVQAGIDLNSASRDDLMSLDGIGEVRADAIIRARPFKVKTELVERRLIPEALYDRINARVIVKPVPTPAPAPPAPQRR